jgi:hypothetical protein
LILFRALFRTTTIAFTKFSTYPGRSALSFFREKRNRKGTWGEGEGRGEGEGVEVRKNFLVRIIDQLMNSVAGRM